MTPYQMALQQNQWGTLGTPFENAPGVATNAYGQASAQAPDAMRAMLAVALASRQQQQQRPIAILQSQAAPPSGGRSFVGIDEYGRGRSYDGAGQLVRNDVGYDSGMSPTSLAATVAQLQQQGAKSAPAVAAAPTIDPNALSQPDNPRIQQLVNIFSTQTQPSQMVASRDAQGVTNFSASPAQYQRPQPGELFDHPAFQRLKAIYGDDAAEQIYNRVVPGGDYKSDFSNHIKQRLAVQNLPLDLKIQGAKAAQAAQMHLAAKDAENQDRENNLPSRYIDKLLMKGQLYQDGSGNWMQMTRVPDPNNPGQMTTVPSPIPAETARMLELVKQRKLNTGVPILPSPEERLRAANPMATMMGLASLGFPQALVGDYQPPAPQANKVPASVALLQLLKNLPGVGPAIPR